VGRGSTFSGRRILGLQGSVGDAAERHQAEAEQRDAEASTDALTRFGHDFSRIPVHGSRLPLLRYGSATLSSGNGRKDANQHREDSLPVTDGPPTAAQAEEIPSRAEEIPPPEEQPATPAEEPASRADASSDKPEERVTDAPSAVAIIPFDHAPLATPGERIIFNAELSDPSPGNFQLDYSTTGGHFTSASGPTTRTIPGLVSGNVDFFVPTPWDGATTVQVVLKVKKTADSSVVRTETWNFGLKKSYPTTMKQREGTGEVNMPGTYSYDIGPALAAPATKPFYGHQTILETFGNWTLANIAPADIKPAYRTANALASAAAVSQHFLGNYAGGHGTFTVDADDRIYDQHSGHPDLSNLVSNLAAPKDVEVALPQTYEAKPGTALGNYTVTRVLKADGTTWKVKKG
jgi:hypothetical protein